MKKVKTKIDFQEDKINIFGKKVKIHFTSTGHKLKGKLVDKNLFKSNAVSFCINIQNLSNTEKCKAALKFCRQFSHLYSEMPLILLQDCETNNEELESHIKDLDYKCKICIYYKKTKPQPVIGLPLPKT